MALVGMKRDNFRLRLMIYIEVIIRYQFYLLLYSKRKCWMKKIWKKNHLLISTESLKRTRSRSVVSTTDSKKRARTILMYKRAAQIAADCIASSGETILEVNKRLLTPASTRFKQRIKILIDIKTEIISN